MIKSNRKAKANIVAVASQRDLDNVDSRKLLIGGQLVFASMQTTTLPPKGYLPQASREAVGGLLGAFQKDVPKVHVHVHPSILNIRKARFGFAIDSYLAWGLRQRKGQHALIGGIERSNGEFHVDVLVFDSGRLVEIYDQELPERGSIRFQAAAGAVVAGIRGKYPKARIVQAGPLGNWDLQDVEYLGDKPLKRISYRPISKTVNSRTDLLVPVTIVFAGIFFNLAAIVSAWNDYSSAQERYEDIAADPNIKQQGGIDANYLAVMTQRRLFMETPRRQDVLPAKILSIVRGVGVIPAVQIVEMRLPAPSISPQVSAGIVVNPDGQENKDLVTLERVPDAWLRISVPKTDGSALDHARDVLITLAESTGMTLRLVHRGWQEDNTRRIFTIEGFIHD